ncbi:MAG TPA: SagB family peptide dehydrogenase [Thermoanaerobaculia bacterium]|nr:SagB family peptide dehydrogenase [Thermoanaerobaculia bacterium]
MNVNASPLLSLPPDGRLVHTPSGGLEIERGGLRLPLGDLEPALRAAVEALAAGGATEAELLTRIHAAGGGGALLRFHQMLADLNRMRLLCREASCSGEPLVTVVPCSRSAPETTGPPEREAAPGAFILSRFACLRREGRSLIAESPLAHAYLVLHGARGALLLARLAAPADSAGLAAEGIAGLREDEAALCLDLLREAGFLSPVDADGGAREDADPELRTWEFHDLLFHSRSRAGRHRNPYGGTWPFRGVIDPLPALQPKRSDDTVELFRPDLEQLSRDDPPFTRVLEERRSRREPGERPVTVRELGELLFRSGRVRKVIPAAMHEVSDRVYPGGGAVYELEIYPVVRSCAGLAPGLYRYDPGDHRLERLSGMSPEARRLLESAGRTAGAEIPEVLLVLAARFQRVTWKYRSMAYAGILKNVGVLYQTMCLVATAMGLSACALGGGDSDLFARAAGTRYTAETSVGELILNRGPADLG